MSLKYSTLTIIGILGILINEVEKFNYAKLKFDVNVFGLNLKRDRVTSLNLTKFKDYRTKFGLSSGRFKRPEFNLERSRKVTVYFQSRFYRKNIGIISTTYNSRYDYISYPSPIDKHSKNGYNSPRFRNKPK